MLTPICPHSLNQRSIILSPEDVIEIEIPKRSEGGIQTVEANFDGSHVIPLRAGDRLRIVRSRETTEFFTAQSGQFSGGTAQEDAGIVRFHGGPGGVMSIFRAEDESRDQSGNRMRRQSERGGDERKQTGKNGGNHSQI